LKIIISVPQVDLGPKLQVDYCERNINQLERGMSLPNRDLITHVMESRCAVLGSTLKVFGITKKSNMKMVKIVSLSKKVNFNVEY